MAIGIILFSWDTKIGQVLDFKYPETLDLTKDFINKVYMSHGIRQSNIMEEELYELNFNEQIILSYCDKTRVVDFGYDLLVLIIHEKEKIEVPKFKLKLKSFAQSVFKKPKESRNQYIIENLELFFPKALEKKVLLLGRAGMGKTSLKKVIFEGHNPKDLIDNPLDPTKGIIPKVYSWLDIKLGLFDTSGQELKDILEDEKKQLLSFENANVVLYIFDFTIWKANKQEIIDEIKFILNLINEKSYETQLILLLHKIDLINKDMIGEIESLELFKDILNRMYDKEIEGIKKIVKKELDLPIYFTSIYPELIFTTYDVFNDILGLLSEETKHLKTELVEKFGNIPKTMSFISNENNDIVAQYISKDFDFRLINYIHNFTVQLNQSFLNMRENDKINYLLMSSYKGLVIIMKYLNRSEFNLMNLVCVSQDLSNEQLIQLAEQCGIKLERIQTEF